MGAVECQSAINSVLSVVEHTYEIQWRGNECLQARIALARSSMSLLPAPSFPRRTFRPLQVWRESSLHFTCEAAVATPRTINTPHNIYSDPQPSQA